MSTIEPLFIYIAIILAIFMAILIIYLIKHNAELKYLISKNDNVELAKNLHREIEGLSRRMNEDLVRFNDLMTKNNQDGMNRLLNNFNSTMYKNMQTTERMVSDFNRRIDAIDKTQSDIKKISDDLLSLEALLRDKKTRGVFGEVELYTILENVFGLDKNRWDKQVKLSNGNIADAVLYAPKPLGQIVIDSKFPLENYQRIYSDNMADQKSFRKAFKDDVLKHINTIAKKYIIADETAPVAYMFIPAEAIYAEIYAFLPEVVEISYRQNVYIVSPTTLMSYLTAIQAIYLGQSRDEKMALIHRELVRLGDEFKRYLERYKKLNADLDRVYNDFKDLDITSNKIVNRFDAIARVDIKEETDEA